MIQQKSRLKRKVEREIMRVIFIAYIFVNAGLGFLATYAYNTLEIVSNSPADKMDRYIDCVNLGECEDITVNTDVDTSVDYHLFEATSTSKTNQANQANLSKLGEVTTHKGVYVNSAILNAIDAKFSKAEADKLKIIMLAECAMDYNVDGKVIYECKSTTVNKNATSWDCGYFQINMKTPCTPESFTIDFQIQSVYNKLYSKNNEGCGGWKCWSSYKFKDSKTIKTSYNMWASK